VFLNGVNNAKKSWDSNKIAVGEVSRNSHGDCCPGNLQDKRKSGQRSHRAGGFIVDSSTGLDDAKPDNVRTMFDLTKEYGVY
jgi:hypothetical protein